MSARFFAFLRLHLCRQLRRPAPLAALALLPLLVGLAALALGGRGGQVLIGVCTGGSDTAQAALLHLQQNGPPGARFVPYDTPQQLRDQVAAGGLECGFMFAPGFDGLAAAGQLQGSITLVQGTSTTLAPLAQEAMSAALLTVLSPALARSYLQGAAPDLALPGLQAWQASYESYLHGPGMMELQVQTLAGAPAQSPAQSLAWPLALALCATVALLWAAWGGAALARGLRRGPLARAVQAAGLWPVLAPTLCAQALPVLVAGGLTLALAARLPGGRLTGQLLAGFAALVAASHSLAGLFVAGSRRM